MNDQTSGLYRTASHLGTALGAGAAIFATPLFYAWGKAAVWRYLLASFGSEYGLYLLWATGAIEAFVIFTLTRALVTFGLSWAMTALAARSLRNS